MAVCGLTNIIVQLRETHMEINNMRQENELLFRKCELPFL